MLLAVLGWLSKTREHVTQIDIANNSKTDRMMVSKVLRTLQSKGLITRREHHTDTRAKTISLTKKGSKLLQTALDIVHQVDGKFFTVLGDQTKPFTIEMLTLMKENEKV